MAVMEMSSGKQEHGQRSRQVTVYIEDSHLYPEFFDAFFGVSDSHRLRHSRMATINAALHAARSRYAESLDAIVPLDCTGRRMKELPEEVVQHLPPMFRLMAITHSGPYMALFPADTIMACGTDPTLHDADLATDARDETVFITHTWLSHGAWTPNDGGPVRRRKARAWEASICATGEGMPFPFCIATESPALTPPDRVIFLPMGPPRGEDIRSACQAYLLRMSDLQPERKNLNWTEWKNSSRRAGDELHVHRATGFTAYGHRSHELSKLAKQFAPVISRVLSSQEEQEKAEEGGLPVFAVSSTVFIR